MKLQTGSLLMLFILLSAIFVMPAAAVGTKCINVKAVTANFGNVNYFFFGMKYSETCEVVTQGGNLNVRVTTTNNSRIIARLPNGTKVKILERGDYISQISAFVKRKRIKGWVSNDYLGNCY